MITSKILPLCIWAIFVILTSHSCSAKHSVVETENGFSVYADNLLVLTQDSHINQFVARLAEYDVQFKENLGSFVITENSISSSVPLTNYMIEESDTGNVTSIILGYQLDGTGSNIPAARLTIWDGESKNGVDLSLSFKIEISENLPTAFNRIYLRLNSKEDEHIYGLGEQYSYFDLKGRNYTVWTREQGVGRNQSDWFTELVELVEPGSGGNYDHTYWPQTSFVSSTRYLFFLETNSYANFNFAIQNYTEILIQEEVEEQQQSSSPISISGYFLVSNSSLLEIVQWTSQILGRQPPLPDWAISGAILGVQGGTEKMLGYVQEAEEHDVALSGMWIQDWSGKITTTFGTRVFWNWKWNETWYPALDEAILNLRKKGVRVLSYINPYLNNKGDIFQEADEQGFFLRFENQSTFLQDFGQFNCGTLDFWNEDAAQWYKELIKENLLRFGFSGWMADFGEYTPVEARSSSKNGGSAGDLSGMERHNLIPLLWAKLNREAVEEAGLLNETMFWTRSGAAGASKYSTMLWAGDQNVDWRYSDGLPSTITAALSAAMSGMGLIHFDIGGFTTIAQITLVRTQELLLRSAEYAAFTPVMRTHEGNQPGANHQVYSSNATWRSFGRLTRIHRALSNYTREAVRENSEMGIPVMRPLFLHYEDDQESFGEIANYEYLYGRDLLVAPILEKAKTSQTVYLPSDEWVHLWDAEELILGGPTTVTVSSPLGYPPVFYRASPSNQWKSLFRNISQEFRVGFEAI